MTRKPPPRLRAFDYIGFHRYFLTICTCDRARLFVDDDSACAITTQLIRTASRERFSIIAYCLMPDHLHALVEGTHEAADFKRFVRIFKQQSAYGWKREHNGTLWQRSYFDRVLRDAEETHVVTRYICENPIRAALAAAAADYPYLGSTIVDRRALLDSYRCRGRP